MRSKRTAARLISLLLLGGSALVMWAAFGSVEPEMGWRAALGAPETLRGILDSFGAWGPVACVVFQVLQVVVAPIPANAITTLRDAAFRTL